MPLAGFKPRSSCIRSDRSSNCARTTALLPQYLGSILNKDFTIQFPCCTIKVKKKIHHSSRLYAALQSKRSANPAIFTFQDWSIGYLHHYITKKYSHDFIGQLCGVKIFQVVFTLSQKHTLLSIDLVLEYFN